MASWQFCLFIADWAARILGQEQTLGQNKCYYRRQNYANWYFRGEILGEMINFDKNFSIRCSICIGNKIK